MVYFVSENDNGMKIHLNYANCSLNWAVKLYNEMSPASKLNKNWYIGAVYYRYGFKDQLLLLPGLLRALSARIGLISC